MNKLTQQLLAGALLTLGFQCGVGAAYVHGNPLSYTDPTGLATEEEIRKAVATLRCAYPEDFKKAARSITMVNLRERGTGRTDLFNNVELNSRLYGASGQPVDSMVHDNFLQTLAHELLHVNETIGRRMLSNSFRAENPLGYFHRQLDDKATEMTSANLTEMFRKALAQDNAGCSCPR